jgi:hypothetical protein
MTESMATPPVPGAHNDEEQRLLLRFLQDQRDAVLRVVEGLPEAAWQKPVVPSGWTVAGMLWHLIGMEHHWRDIILGFQDGLPQVDLPESDGEDSEWDPNAPFECELPSSVIIGVYKAEWHRSDEILTATPLSAFPPGLHLHYDQEYAAQIASVRFIVLHIIEETAVHAGHLEIARELLDGQTRLAGR